LGALTGSIIVLDALEFQIPAGVRDLGSFRQWADSDEFPKEGRICYLNGEVWVDMSKEQLYTHTGLKTEVNTVLRSLAKSQKLGRYLHDGVRLTNPAANISVCPDGLFYTLATIQAGRLRRVEGKKNGFVELEGTADMVLEAVSDSSVGKDTVKLRDLYWRAGLAEYWLIDVREGRLVFEILAHSSQGYVAIPKVEGWVASAGFGQSFKLTQHTDDLGDPDYTLEVR